MYQPGEEDDDNGHLDPDFSQMTTSIINGLKSGSKWFVVDDTYICHINSKSVDGKYTLTGSNPSADGLGALLRQV